MINNPTKQFKNLDIIYSFMHGATNIPRTRPYISVDEFQKFKDLISRLGYKGFVFIRPKRRRGLEPHDKIELEYLKPKHADDLKLWSVEINEEGTGFDFWVAENLNRTIEEQDLFVVTYDMEDNILDRLQTLNVKPKGVNVVIKQ